MRQDLTDPMLEALRWRYAAKHFDRSRTIPDGTWGALEEALVLTPSAYGLQPWKFIVVKGPHREELKAAAWGQSQVEDCSHLVVFAARESADEAYVDSIVEDMARTRGVAAAALSGYRQMVLDDVVYGVKSRYIREWAARQAYIALGSLVTAAAMLRVDACPMEGFDPERYDEILGLKGTGYRSVVVCALGYRSSEDKYADLAKVRFGKERVVRYV